MGLFDRLFIRVQVQIEPGVGGRQDPAEGQERRPRHHSRLHPIAAALETGESRVNPQIVISSTEPEIKVCKT